MVKRLTIMAMDFLTLLKKVCVTNLESNIWVLGVRNETTRNLKQ